uniref:COP9 signalosome complex subunit 5b n=1 Tax=Arundo donax TaxID=35708 RepID=A0A0A9EBP8_ARUDO
MLFSSSHV